MKDNKNTENNKNINLIPYPKKISIEDNRVLEFNMDSDFIILVNEDSILSIANYYRDLIKRSTGIEVNVKNGLSDSSNNYVFLKKSSFLDLPSEGYLFEVSDSGITIESNHNSGIFYGLQTLRQLLPVSLDSSSIIKNSPPNSSQKSQFSCEVPFMKIEDYPDLSWRGFMLDVCRHFHGKDTIKKFLDILALLKMNVFHWHLTEDQGWRIEIKKYPKLIEIGSKRKDTQVKHSRNKKFRGEPHEGYFSQEDVKEILQYAKERFINVVPEIEIPGHSQAAIASYPNLGCTGEEVDVSTKFGIIDIVYCPGKKETFQFWYDVLDEIISLFPSEVIHTGGDEVPKKRWKECPDCQRLIKEKGLKDEEDLQVYVTNTIATYLASKGRRLMGWNEILDENLELNAIGQYWAHSEAEVIEHIKKGRDFVVSPSSHVYLDHSYKNKPLKKVYGFNPYLKNLTKSEKKHILGLEAPAWTEWMPNRKKLEWQVFPRLIAVAEKGWSPESEIGFDDFFARLEKFESRLDKLEVNYAKKNERDYSFKANLKKILSKLFNN